MIRAVLGQALPAELRGHLTLQQFLLPLPVRADPESLHLTLVHLGDCDASTLQAAHEGFEGLRSPPFPLTLAGLGLFGGARPHTAWAGVAASPPLLRLQTKVETIARRAGCPVPSRKFLPHVTLGRFPALARDDADRLERAIVQGLGFRAGPWQVEHLTLWQSHRTGKPPYQTVLAGYRLG